MNINCINKHTGEVFNGILNSVSKAFSNSANRNTILQNTIHVNINSVVDVVYLNPFLIRFFFQQLFGTIFDRTSHKVNNAIAVKRSKTSHNFDSVVADGNVAIVVISINCQDLSPPK